MIGGWVLITRLLPDTERLLDIGIRIGFALVLGFLAQRLVFLVVGRGQTWIERAGRGSDHAQQRARTVGAIFRNLVTVLIGAAVTLYALSAMGWDVRPLLATAGIAGVALGFGAQTLVRDVIAGFFIIIEDQFGVGDVIEVNGKAATVEAVTMRCTTLRDFHGFLHFVPNGEMKIVVNRSRGWNRLAVDVPISPDEDIDRALETVSRTAAEMSHEPVWRERMLDDIKVWGIEGLSAQDVQIRLVIKAMPGPDVHETARELRRRIHRALLEAGIRSSAQREIAISTLGPGNESIANVRAS